MYSLFLFSAELSVAKKQIDAKKSIVKRSQNSIGMLSSNLVSNLVKPKIASSGLIRRKAEIVSSTPTQNDSGITSIVPDSVSVQKKIDKYDKADRLRRSAALRKKLVISDSSGDIDTSIPDDPDKVPSMESIQKIDDSGESMFQYILPSFYVLVFETYLAIFS